MDSWNWKGEQPTLFTEDGRHSDCTSCHESDLKDEKNQWNTIHVKQKDALMLDLFQLAVLFVETLPCILPVLQQDRMMVFTCVCLTTNNNL